MDPNNEKWTPAEELALTRAWIDSSENSIKGDGQSNNVFWADVRAKFFQAMGCGDYRNPDTISGKWTAMRTKLTYFNNIYNRLANNQNRKGGTNDFDVMKEAHKQYRAEKSLSFTMIEPWEALKESASAIYRQN
ncbi:glutathione S-transferase T3-like [Bidens hawaiensis]|uniref:glutathione S-transferase T3-like n=1 Tax=Bidens hawaiensis TaxID=980011 RepID=UPI00404AFD25